MGDKINPRTGYVIVDPRGTILLWAIGSTHAACIRAISDGKTGNSQWWRNRKRHGWSCRKVRIEVIDDE